MTRNDYVRELKRLGKMWKTTRFNLVIVTAEAGAGHMRQAYFLERLADLLGVSSQVTRVDLSLESDKRTEQWNKWYKWLQNKPAIYEMLTKVMKWPIWYGFLDRQLQQFDRTRELERRITASRNFKPDQMTVVMVTHVIGAVSGANWLVKSGQKGWLVEFVPDPWRGGVLLTMTGPTNLGKRHLVVVHDNPTAAEYRSIRPQKDRDQVLVMGTLSDPDYWWQTGVGKRKTTTNRHLLIEFSGNRIPLYEELIVNFLTESAEQLEHEHVRISIHVMHHTEILNMMREICAKYFQKGFWEVVAGKDVRSAIKSRQAVALGRGKFGLVDVTISKGGEVTLEDRRGMLVAGVYGAGHEGKDIETGVMEGRVMDLRSTSPRGWWVEIRKKLDERKHKTARDEVDSKAMLALLKAVSK